jgi:DNA-binding MarR family transcriptional regulator
VALVDTGEPDPDGTKPGHAPSASRTPATRPDRTHSPAGRAPDRAGADGVGVDLDRLATELHSAAIHLLRRVRQADAELGITPARLSALSVLVFGGPMTVTRLAEIEQVAGPTMSRIVAALEEGGLVERTPIDGRSNLLAATAAGCALMDRGRGRRVAILTERLRTRSDAELHDLERAVTLLRALA